MIKRLSLALFLCASTVAAQDVILVSPAERSVLSDASLLRALDETAVPQDYVAAARADYRRLLTALYSEGYYAGDISITVNGVEAANITAPCRAQVIEEVRIVVKPGRRFRFGEAQITPLPPDAVISEEFAEGRTARSARIRSAVAEGVLSWRNAGYPRAQVADEDVIARHSDGRLDVDITLEPGPRLRFGVLTVSGTDTVSDDRVREIAGLSPGRIYSPVDIAEAERRLRRVGTFDSVALTEGDVLNPDGTLPINVQLSDAKPRRIGFGIEVSTIEGLTLSSFWLHRNFFGGAERFRAEAEVSGISGETGGIDYRLGASFTRPATFDPDIDYFLKAEISREDEPEFLLDKIGFETGVERRVRSDLNVRAAVGVLRAREETDIETREYTLFTVPMDATLDRRDAPSDAREGYFIDLDATPFASIDGDIRGAQLFGDVRGYYTVSEGTGLTFAGRVQVGSLLNASLTEAPADFLFYSGGGGTVRGQPYQSLGIDSIADGEAITTGGTSFIGAQLETRFGIRENLSLVGFYDIGHVGAGTVPGEDGDWHAGAGLGLRYSTGIGPIRLDLGTQASGDDAGEDLQVYIGIGQSF